MNLYHETPTLWQSLLDHLLPPITLPELQIFDASTQHYLRQIERRREPVVDSSAGRAVKMSAILRTPGKYYADGSGVLLPATDSDGTL